VSTAAHRGPMGGAGSDREKAGGTMTLAARPSRAVTQRCQGCERRFAPSRRDARYCSGACRQRAHRARADVHDIDRQIDEAKARYWRLIRRKAEALSVHVSRIVTDEAQFVDPEGNVYVRGKLAGAVRPNRPGWAAWGLEAAGPPFSPPTGSWVPAEGHRAGRNEQ
jgi:hypothetical protein